MRVTNLFTATVSVLTTTVLASTSWAQENLGPLETIGKPIDGLMGWQPPVYREYMGHIIDPIELVGLPGLTKQEIKDLAEKLPFSRERPKRNKSRLIFSGSLRNGLRIKTKFTGNQGRFEWGGLKEWSIKDGQYNPSEPVTFFGAKHNGVVKSKWLIGTHTLLLGEGLLSGSMDTRHHELMPTDLASKPTS